MSVLSYFRQYFSIVVEIFFYFDCIFICVNVESSLIRGSFIKKEFFSGFPPLSKTKCKQVFTQLFKVELKINKEL